MNENPQDAPLRLPPQNLEAEAGVLGSILQDPAAFEEVDDLLEPEDFYRDSHRDVYRALRELRAAGSPVDALTLADHLGPARLAAVGGLEALVGFQNGVPHAANARYYAAIVRQKALARSLVEWAHDTLRECYSDEHTADALLESAEARLFALGRRRGAAEARPLHEFAAEAMERQRVRRGGEVAGVGTGFPDLDDLTDGFLPGQFVILAARPSLGKTALALQFAETAVFRGGVPVLFFSLEMPGVELAERLLVGRSGVDGRRFRAGVGWRPGEEAAVHRAFTETHEARGFFIDDSGSRTAAQVAGVARRHRARHRVGLVLVDFLQLVEPPEESRRASRQEQVTAISRRMKLLAKELGVPVVCLSQLNRQAEGREDHRPRMSDLRECLTADTPVWCSQTGRMVPVAEYVRTGSSPCGYGLDDRSPLVPWKVRPAAGVRFWPTGVKPVFRVRTATGRVVRCTANHPFRTLSGWTRLDALRVGRRIAVPRCLPEPACAGRAPGVSRDEARLLGYLISDGTYLKHCSVGYVKADPVLVDDVCRIAGERFGVTARDHPCQGVARQIALTGPRRGPGGNPVINWLRSLGVHGQKGHEKRVPAAVFSSPNAVVADFLGALWAGDGCVVPRKRGGWVLKFTSTSMGLLQEIQMLLLRFGIISVVGKPGRNSKSTRDIATVTVGASREVVRFAERIPVPGVKGERLALAASACRSAGENSLVDRMPLEVGDLVTAAKRAAGDSWRGIGYRVQGKQIGPAALASVAARLGDDRLAALAASEVLWDRVESVTPDGEEETYDVRFPGLHNFVAGGIFVHNSGAIEQDADLVLLLHRPDYFDPDDRPGEAEVIVAKNRNGATGTIRLAFARHLARFASLAPHDAPPDAAEF